jgi:hypothetical protein
LSGQGVEWCSVFAANVTVQGASETGLITPEKALPDGQAEVPIPGLNPGGTDLDSWDAKAHG